MGAMFYIYGLTDPRTRTIEYIGVTVRPERRFTAHVRSSKAWQMQDWIDGLADLGLEPVMQILSEVETKRHAYKAEAMLIRLLQPSVNRSGIRTKRRLSGYALSSPDA